MKTSIPRLRRVRFNDGRTIEVIRPAAKPRYVQDALKKTIARALDSYVGEQMVGWAFVAWAGTGEVFVNYENQDGSMVAGGQVPQYVKDVLLAEVATRWANE